MRRTVAGGIAALAVALGARGQGPDPYFVFPFEGTWNSAVGSGTAVTLFADFADDLLSPVQTLPFGFPFLGITESDFVVSVNGWLSFNPGQAGPDNSNSSIPHPQAPNRLVAPFWDDLVLDDGNAAILWDVTGAAPNRVATVEWRDASAFSTTSDLSQLSFQVALFETTGVIEFRYGGHHRGYDGPVGNPLDMDASIGIEDASGTMGTDAGGGSTALVDPPPWNLRFVPNDAHPDGIGGENGAQGRFLVSGKVKFFSSAGDPVVPDAVVWTTAISDDGAGNIGFSPIQLRDGTRTEPMLGRLEGTHFHASGPRGDSISGKVKLDGTGLVTSFRGVLQFRTPLGNYQLKVKGTRIVP